MVVAVLVVVATVGQAVARLMTQRLVQVPRNRDSPAALVLQAMVVVQVVVHPQWALVILVIAVVLEVQAYQQASQEVQLHIRVEEAVAHEQPALVLVVLAVLEVAVRAQTLAREMERQAQQIVAAAAAAHLYQV